MGKFHQVMSLIILILIIALILFSIYGAFRGAADAHSFFNSTPLAIYWCILALTLATGFVFFKKLIRFFGLFLIHIACVLVLAGAMYGSQAGHRILKELFGIDKICRGQMVIDQTQESNQVILNTKNQTFQLPFSIRLNEFKIEYYEPKILQIQTRQGMSWKIPIQLDTDFDLGNAYGKVRILRQFRNFVITQENNTRKIIDSNRPGVNPAIEVQIEYPDGTQVVRYVFERFGGHSHPEDKFLLSYGGAIRDYISNVSVIKNGQIVANKNIEVNHPLHYGGYYFYQQSYDAQNAQYTVLEVVSDNGLSIVYSGYLMLVAGVFWHFWFRHLRKGVRHGD